MYRVHSFLDTNLPVNSEVVDVFIPVGKEIEKFVSRSRSNEEAHELFQKKKILTIYQHA